MTLHLSANYMYKRKLWVVVFVENLFIPTPPVFLGFRNVATRAPLFNAVTVSMSSLCRLISCCVCKRRKYFEYEMVFSSRNSNLQCRMKMRNAEWYFIDVGVYKVVCLKSV